MDPNRLIPGKTYFVCGYHHPKYPIPYVQTFVYAGKNTDIEGESRGKNEYLFQHPQKYYAKDLAATPGYGSEGPVEPADFRELIINEDDLHLIKDYPELVEWVISLSKSTGAEKVL